MSFEEKVILVTGSSKGIGESIVKRFSKEKSKVVITYSGDPQGAEKVEAECKQLGARDTLVVHLNLRDNQSIKEVISAVEQKFGHIDFLINNAGVISWESFEKETFEDIESQVRTNLEGMIKMTLASLEQVKGGIVNVASRAGHIPYPGRATYCATKFGVVGFTKSLAMEYPDLKVFSISPGAVKTQMWDFQEGAEPDFIADSLLKALNGEIELEDYDLPLWKKV